MLGVDLVDAVLLVVCLLYVPYGEELLLVDSIDELLRGTVVDYDHFLLVVWRCNLLVLIVLVLFELQGVLFLDDLVDKAQVAGIVSISVDLLLGIVPAIVEVNYSIALFIVLCYALLDFKLANILEVWQLFDVLGRLSQAHHG